MKGICQVQFKPTNTFLHLAHKLPFDVQKFFTNNDLAVTTQNYYTDLPVLTNKTTRLFDPRYIINKQLVMCNKLVGHKLFLSTGLKHYKDIVFGVSNLSSKIAA